MHVVKPVNECRVLVVDDNSQQREALYNALHQYFNLIQANKSDDVIAFFEADDMPDMVLIALDEQDDSGLLLCLQLRARRNCEDIPIMLVTGNISDARQEICWQAGATDFVVNPVPATLIHRTRNHLKNYLQLKTMEKLLMHDTLTGVKDRNFMHEEAIEITSELSREEKEMGIILLDIDDFKKLNDTFGHEHGDKCLKAVAKAISVNCKRPDDTVIRFGGEEFLIILPRTGEKGAQCVAQAIVEAVSQIKLMYSNNVVSRVTASVGVTWRENMQGYTLEEMIHEADMAMYDAKRSGKNRFVMARPVSTGERKKYRCRPVIPHRFINSIGRSRDVLSKYRL